MADVSLDYISLATLVCSLLSILGSILIFISYVVARTKSTPKTAYLIVQLSISDFFWFFAAALQSCYWIFNDGRVPTMVCYIAGPSISYFRIASLIWTSVISYNVLMSVKVRKWNYKSENQLWNSHYKYYYCIVLGCALPGAIITVIQQHMHNNSLGCGSGYEPLGHWYTVSEYLYILNLSYVYNYDHHFDRYFSLRLYQFWQGLLLMFMYISR